MCSVQKLRSTHHHPSHHQLSLSRLIPRSSDEEALSTGGDKAMDDDPEDEIERLVAYGPKYGFCV